MRITKKFVMLLATLLLTMMASDSSAVATAPPVLPNPVLFYAGAEYFTKNGTDFVRYHFQVDNSSAYPDAMFAPAPALPPCGSNTKAARTWVDIFDQRGKRLQGFCALGKAADLNKIWFALPVDEIPPSWIYIELTDRETSTKYKSNLADTTM